MAKKNDCFGSWHNGDTIRAYAKAEPERRQRELLKALQGRRATANAVIKKATK